MYTRILDLVVGVTFPTMLAALVACSGSPPAVVSADVPVPAPPAAAQANGPFIDLWVDPLHGDDSLDGAARTSALRTITAAWQRIPAGVPLSNAGYRILLVAGDYSERDYPPYWEDRHGTAEYPILVVAADEARSARLVGFLNLFDVDYVELHGITVANQGDVFHCEQCRHLVIDNSAMDGARQAHETIKINQSQYITIENSDIQGSYENAIDFVAVQYATIRNNRIHAADDWCAYVKGGSASVTVESNEIYDCGTGGFTAGQGTGFEYMISPWLHYEAYDVRVVNNIIHDTDGAGLGVNGGYDILFAYNTLYRVGARSHVLEVVHGSRSCDGDSAGCQSRHAEGGWGPIQVGDAEPIPNRNVFIYNNLIVNPTGYRSQWQHFAIHGARLPSMDAHIPSPAVTDDNLQVRGNVIWNGPADHPLGLGDDSGCLPTNPTCNATQLLADNAINVFESHLVDPSAGDFRVEDGIELPAPLPVPNFPAWDEMIPPVPQSVPETAVAVDYAGHARASADRVGALGAGTAPPTATPDATERLFLPQIRIGATGQ